MEETKQSWNKGGAELLSCCEDPAMLHSWCPPFTNSYPRCSPKDGQCKCLPNVVSRQCNEPAPGYFFLPLDYYIYEAEHAKPLSGSAPLVRSWLFRCCTERGSMQWWHRSRGWGEEPSLREQPEHLVSRKIQSKSLDHPQFSLVLHGHDYPVTMAVTKGQSLQHGVTCKAVLAAPQVQARLAWIREINLVI